MPHRIGTTCIWQTARRTGKCHAEHQCRERLCLWTRFRLHGTERQRTNDVFYNNGGRIETKTNYSGGIQGGISNGQDIYFRVAFKPVATVLMEQHTVNINGIDTTMKAKGRHDPCVLPRAVPIVEAMAAITVYDYYLIDRTTQL